MNNGKSCSIFYLILTSSLLAASALWTRANATECPQGAPRHAPNEITGETCPDIGRMGSLKLAIPKNYILGPDFVYQGVDIWNPESYKNRPKQQSFDLDIRYFSIRVRLKNFKPVETPDDMIDYNLYMGLRGHLPPPEKQWIFIQFDYPSDFKKENKTVNLEFILKRYVNSEILNRPNFILQADHINGLAHYISPEPPSIHTRVEEVNEVFYDDKDNSRIIYCTNYLKHVAPYDILNSCHHLFYIYNGSISINVSLIKDKNYYISNYKEIEARIKNIFDAFVVN